MIRFELRETSTTAQDSEWVPNARTFFSPPGFGFRLVLFL